MAIKTATANEGLLEASPELSKLIDSIGIGVAAIKRLEAEVEAQKVQLREQAKTAYFAANFQADTPVHTYDANGRTFVAQINFENAYFLNKERYQQLQALLGEQHPLADHIQEQPVVNINVHELDQDERVEFYRAIKDVCEDHGVQGFVDEKYVVAPEFHDERHEVLPRVNQAIDGILPLKVAITI